MYVSDCCWHWQDTVLDVGCERVLSIYFLYLELLSLQVATTAVQLDAYARQRRTVRR